MEKIELDEESEKIISKILNNVDYRKFGLKSQLKNEFFRKELFKKYESSCAKCKCGIGNIYTTKKKGKEIPNPLTIHHVTYDWHCPYRIRKKIQCKAESCKTDYPKDFANCMQNCVLLCSMCHYKEHLENKRTTGNWTLSREIEPKNYTEDNPKDRSQHGKKWTEHQTKKLTREFELGNSIEIISQRLKRSHISILYKLKNLGKISEEDFAKFKGPKEDKKPSNMDLIKEEYVNVYEPWTSDQDEKLLVYCYDGMKIKKLSELFKRQPSAIRSRLKKLGIQKKIK